MTQELEVLNLLRRYRNGLTKQAILRELGVYESGEYISRLRKKGHDIDTVWFNVVNPRNGRTIRIGKYVYKGEK